MLRRMFRALIWLVVIGAFIWFGATVKLGNKTFFGHVRAIWHTETGMGTRGEVAHFQLRPNPLAR